MDTEKKTVRSTPNFIVGLLVLVAFLLGACLMEMISLSHQFDRGVDYLSKNLDKVSTEVRVVGVDIENTNAIMIREGKEKPGDRKGSGPTQPKE